jgi:peptide/nickel transport system permease protein
MRKYLGQRLLIAIPTLFGVTLLIFIAMRVLPGDPLSAISGEGGGTYVLSKEQLQAARVSLGLDRPYVVQYLDWLRDIMRGDLGKSFWRGEPIRELIFRRAPITGQIALMAIVLSWVIGLPVGLVGALWRNSWTDYAFLFVVTLFLAIPSFWVGLMVVLSLVLAFTWRPPPLSIVYLWDDPIRNLLLTTGPALILGVALAAMMARITRSSVLEVLGEDYVRTARAKGLRERIVVWRHALVNAMLPILTVTGTAFGALLGGSVAVERAFGVPGLGLALVFAVAERDWMLIQNLVLLYGVIFVLINLVVDVSYGWFDPRIRYQ